MLTEYAFCVSLRLGQYFYIEVSGRDAGAFATFETPQFNWPGTKCLTMWRNMYGFHIGRLAVYEVTDSGVVIQRAFWQGEERTSKSTWTYMQTFVFDCLVIGILMGMWVCL